MWNVLSLKLGVLTIAAMIGWIRSCTSAFTTFTNAAPITNATAISSRFPRSRNARNSLNMARPLVDVCGDSRPRSPGCPRRRARTSELGQRLQDEPVGGEAAVDREIDAGDAGGVVGGQERERRRDLGRLHEPAQRHAGELAVEVAHQRRADRALGHLGVREARADAVD